METKERQAIRIGCGVFVIGLVLAAAISWMKLGDSVTFIALLLTPLLVYGIASGKVQEFTAPGGWGAKLREAAQTTVTPMPTAMTSLSEAMQQLEVIDKGGLAELQSLGGRLQRNKPIALTFKLGQLGYRVDTAIMYIKFLRLTDPQMSVLILNEENHFVAMTEGTTMLNLLDAPPLPNTPSHGEKIVMAISKNDKGYLLNLPGFHVNTVKATESNATALEKMRTENTRSIVVVDDDGHPTGVVKRDDIVARLLEKLAMPDK